MGTLATFEKQPNDVQDYDVDFSEYLDGLSDTADTMTVTAETGITVDSSNLNTTTGVAKVWLSGGTNGSKYKVTVKLVTTGGRTKEAEITIKVKEI